ncbi:MAG: chemotaxis protein CheD [Planctomycetota bacterium]
MGKRITVDHANLAVTDDPTATLITYGISTSVAVAVLDRTRGIGGLLHYMLPSSKTLPDGAENQPFLYADTGLPPLFRSAYRLGSTKHTLEVYLVGGSDMIDTSCTLDLGRRNLHVARRIFEKNGIDITAEEVGGTVLRTLTVDLQAAEVCVWVPGAEKSRMLAPQGVVARRAE